MTEAYEQRPFRIRQKGDEKESMQELLLVRLVEFDQYLDLDREAGDVLQQEQLPYYHDRKREQQLCYLVVFLQSSLCTNFYRCRHQRGQLLPC